MAVGSVAPAEEARNGARTARVSVAAARVALAGLAREVGYTQVSVSHAVSPLMKLVSRGDTTVADAYLSPVLRRYVDRVARELPAPSFART